MIVDAHSHVFPEPRGQVREGPTRDGGYGRMRVGGRLMQLMPPLNRRTEFTVEMLLANLDWAGVDAAVLLQGTYYGECDGYVAEAAGRHPDRLVGALWCDPWRPGFRPYFEEQVAQGAYQTAAVRAIAEAHEGLRIVIAHLAHPRIDDEADPELRRRRDEQLALGELPNVWFDFASFPALPAGDQTLVLGETARQVYFGDRKGDEG